jgi:predicted nucleic acid-binding Zn ribbon protein
MTRYECRNCGQLADFADAMGGTVHRECPVCEDLTVWETAFADDEAGVSF